MKQIEVIYDEFYSVLKEASNHEIALRDFASDQPQNSGGYNIFRIMEIAVIELKEYLERFIEMFHLQNPFLFLGRDIKCFADAAFVIFQLKPLIVAFLYTNPAKPAFDLMSDIMACCGELKTMLREIPVPFSS